MKSEQQTPHLLVCKQCQARPSGMTVEAWCKENDIKIKTYYYWQRKVREEYLKVFLTDGEVPIDDSASERALRNFTIGRKNWVTIYTPRGAEASAVMYSVTETARANNLNVYYYLDHLLTMLLEKMDDEGNISDEELEPIMPWSKTLPAECYSKRRN